MYICPLQCTGEGLHCSLWNGRGLPVREYGWLSTFICIQNTRRLVCRIEGISITHGPSPRHHLWTYAVGLNANPDNYLPQYQCPCTVLGTTMTLPTFLGNDYYCNSGNPSTSSLINGHLYPDRLWDNSGPSCVSGSTCCDNPDQPWFKKKLTQSANEDVEMRWCAGDSPVSNEATATTRVELYVRVA